MAAKKSATATLKAPKAKLDNDAFNDHGTIPAAIVPKPEDYKPETLLHWYEQMLILRRVEERAAQLYGQQKIKGFCHLYIGQEAVGIGLEAALRPSDYVITAYRDHGNAMARGISPRAVMAELFGKATGCSRGRGGSMHMFSKEHNFLGGHGIVGGQIPLGAGAAFALKYQNTDNVCVCLFGDGAARQGALHEAFNLAMLWKLPVIFICENNNYAMGTSVERSSNVTDIYKLGLAYDMPSAPVNGMDIFSMHAAMTEAVARARRGDGPTLLEAKTYRYLGHSMSDPAKYRTKDELAAYKDHDPIIGLKHYLDHHNLADEAHFEAVEAKVKAIVDDAVQFADESPFLPANELYTDIYVQADYPFMME